MITLEVKMIVACLTAHFGEYCCTNIRFPEVAKTEFDTTINCYKTAP